MPAAGIKALVHAVLVMTLEYWPGGDASRRRHAAWAAAARRATPAGRHWLVVSTLGGRLRSGTVELDGDHVAALLATLPVLEDGDDGVSRAVLDEVTRLAVARIGAVVETNLELPPAAVLPQPPATGMVPEPELKPGQRRGARRRVLALEHLTEEQVQDMFLGERDHPAIVRGLRKAGVLIGLRVDGERLYPVFQFLGARPHPVVAHVNLLLRADLDPWRAATWWASREPVLQTEPLTLLGSKQEHRLYARADASVRLI